MSRRRCKHNKKEFHFNPFDIIHQQYKIDSCTSKKKYDSEWQAKYDADYLEEKYGGKMYIYHCRFCGYWHLTKSSKIFEGEC